MDTPAKSMFFSKAKNESSNKLAGKIFDQSYHCASQIKALEQYTIFLLVSVCPKNFSITAEIVKIFFTKA